MFNVKLLAGGDEVLTKPYNSICISSLFTCIVLSRIISGSLQIFACGELDSISKLELCLFWFRIGCCSRRICETYYTLLLFFH